MRAVDNERGGATLLYVLMVMLVLMVLAPVILNAKSNEAARDQADSHKLIATNLAVSGMETFISYLDTYQSGDREAFVNSYPGITTESYYMPDGTYVRYSLQLDTSSDPAEVTAAAAVGEGTLERGKTITYTIRTSSSVGNPYEDPSIRIPLPAENDSEIYIGGAITDDETNPIKEGIGKVIDYFTDVVTEQNDQYLSNAIVCEDCTDTDDIASAFNAAGTQYVPAVIHFPNVTLLDELAGQFGTEERPVVLIFNRLTVSNDANFQVYGSMIVLGDLIFNNNATMKIQEGNGTDGNLYVGGKLYAKNNLRIDEANRIYIKDLTLENNADIYGDTLITANTLTTNNNTNFYISTDMITGKLEAKNNSVIQASAGDVYVKNSLISNNNVTLTSGGSIAVGGELNSDNHMTVTTGGGTTTFPLISDSSWTPDGGGVGSGGGWEPARK